MARFRPGPLLLAVWLVGCSTPPPPPAAPPARPAAARTTPQPPPDVWLPLGPLRLQSGLPDDQLAAARQRRYTIAAALARCRKLARARRDAQRVGELLASALEALRREPSPFDERDHERYRHVLTWRHKVYLQHVKDEVRYREIRRRRIEERYRRGEVDLSRRPLLHKEVSEAWSFLRISGDPPTPRPAPAPALGGEDDGGQHLRAAPGPRSWKPATAPAGLVRLRVEREPLPLRAMRCWVRVDGARARVVQELLYHNPDAVRREGTLQLRLPPGASPYLVGFGAARWETPSGQRPAPDADPTAGPLTLPEPFAERRWSGLKLAVAAPRARAATAYHQTVARRVDPALLEWEGEGVFSLRIFPLERNADSRVVIGYDVDLAANVGEDGAAELAIALPRGGRPGRRALRVEQAASGPAATVLLDRRALRAATVGERRRWTATQAVGHALHVRVPLEARPLLGVDRAAGPVFALCAQPAIEPAPREAVSDRAIFVLDGSQEASASYARQLALLEQALARGAGWLRRFRVLRHDVTASWWRPGWTRNDAAGRAAVARWAAAQTLAGASDMACAFDALRAAPPTRCWLFLLGGGHGGWSSARGATEARALPAGIAQVLAVNQQPRRCALLEALARLQRAAVIPADQATRPEVLLGTALRGSWRIASATLDGARSVVLDASSLVVGQRLRVVGRGVPQPGAALRLTLVSGHARRVVSVPLAAPLQSPLAARAYGQRAAVAVERRVGRGRLSLAYARHYRVPGPAISLVMLESEDDYRRYRITTDLSDDRKLIADHPVPPRAAITPLDPLLALARKRLPADSIAWLARVPAGALVPAPATLAASVAKPGVDPELRWPAADRLAAAGDVRAALRVASAGLIGSSPQQERRELRRLAYQLIGWRQPAAAARWLRRLLIDRAPTAADLLALGWAEEAAGRPLRALLAYQLVQAASPTVTSDLPRLAAQLLPQHPELSGLATRFPRRQPAALQVQVVWSHPAADVDLGWTDASLGPQAADVEGPGPERLAIDPLPGAAALQLDHYAAPGARLGRYEEAALVAITRGASRQLRLVRLIPTHGVDHHVIQLPN